MSKVMTPRRPHTRGVKAGGGLGQGLHWWPTSKEETGPGDLGRTSVHEGVRLHVDGHSEVDHLLTIPYSKAPPD